MTSLIYQCFTWTAVESIYILWLNVDKTLTHPSLCSTSAISISGCSMCFNWPGKDILTCFGLDLREHERTAGLLSRFFLIMAGAGAQLWYTSNVNKLMVKNGAHWLTVEHIKSTWDPDAAGEHQKTALLCSQRDDSDYIAHYKAERNRLMEKMTEWIVGKSFVQQERVVLHPCVKNCQSDVIVYSLSKSHTAEHSQKKGTEAVTGAVPFQKVHFCPF